MTGKELEIALRHICNKGIGGAPVFFNWDGKVFYPIVAVKEVKVGETITIELSWTIRQEE